MPTTAANPSFPTTPLARLSGASGPIHALAFSSGSGQYILAGSADRAIRLYNSTTRSSSPENKLQFPIQTFKAHGYEVLDLAVSGDNARFASVGGDKTVFVWDVAAGAAVRRFAGHAARVNCVAFGGGGESSGRGDRGGGGTGEEQVVVSGSFDGSVKIWDLRGRSDTRPIMTLSDAKDSVSDVAVRGGEVFVGSVDGRVRVYDLAMGVVDTDVIASSGVTSVCPASVDGESYLVGSLDSTLRLMDRRSGKCLQSFTHEGFANETYRLRSTLAMADSCAICGAEDGSVFVWDVLSGGVRARVWHREKEGGSGSKRDVVSAVAWNQVRKTWASAGGDGTVVVWGAPE